MMEREELNAEIIMLLEKLGIIPETSFSEDHEVSPPDR